ncbi:MAG: glycosyltransferase family 4 protein [Candidatus Hydrogenedentes bacterium]|nr:glycosyltransferase family 4 protein [Candidatus Hydrogenedentota bacterium]
MSDRPRICILTSQYFGWGIYGGFGSMSRKLAENLARVGYTVSVIVPRRQDQQPIEHINGVEVLSFSPLDISEAIRLMRTSNAEIFHSQDPTFLTFLAQQVQPKRIHLVTCRDPRDFKDWFVEFWYATPRRRLLTPFNYLTESSYFVKRAVRRAHGVYCPAHFLKSKIQRMYSLREAPTLLPNLIDVPESLPRKSDTPTITFIARWDKRKRPWIFLELAEKFPDYRFIAVGQGSASAETGFDRELRQRYSAVKNLELPGFINRFKEPERIHQILSDTWVFVSTAAREGLPLTFLEAAAYGCSILSVVNPDEFATRFGVQVRDDDFAAALRACLANNPLEKGRAAHDYVRGTYETTKALEAHEEQYARHLNHAR